MDEYLPDDMAGSGEVFEYGDGSWSQFFSDGSELTGSADGTIVYTTPDGLTYDATSQSVSGAPPAPELIANPGAVVKIGDYFYKYVAATNTSGQTVYRGTAVTASQAQQAQLAEQNAKNQMIFPIIAVGVVVLLMGN